MFSIFFQQICFCTFSTFKNIPGSYKIPVYQKYFSDTQVLILLIYVIKHNDRIFFFVIKSFYLSVLKNKKLKETKSLTKWNILGKLGQTLYGYQLIYYVWIILKGQYLLLHRTDMIFLTSVLTTELCKTDIYWFFVCFGINFLSFLSQWSIR